MGDVRLLVEKLAALLTRAQFPEDRLAQRAKSYLAEADRWLEENPPPTAAPRFPTKPCRECGQPFFWTIPEHQIIAQKQAVAAARANPTARVSPGAAAFVAPSWDEPQGVIPTDPRPVAPEEMPPEENWRARLRVTDKRKVFGVGVFEHDNGYIQAVWRPLEEAEPDMIYVRHVCPKEVQPTDAIRGQRWFEQVASVERAIEEQVATVAAGLDELVDELEDL